MTADTMGYACAALGIAIGVAGLYVSLASLREGEPRAARRALTLAILSPVPFLMLGLLDYPGRGIANGVLLGASAVVAVALLVPTGRPKLSNADASPRTRHDERDTMFARARMQPGSAAFEAYYTMRPEHRAKDDRFREAPGLCRTGGKYSHRLAFEAAEASFDVIGALRGVVDGPVAEARDPLTPERATTFIKGWARQLGAHSVGVCRLQLPHIYSHIGRGEGTWGDPIDLSRHAFAVAVTVEMGHAAMACAPLAPVVMESARQYVGAGVIALQIAHFLRRLGYSARAHIDGNYRVICPLVARDAGLGEIGRMGLLMTPDLGPRVRLAVVTTELDLIPDARRPAPAMIEFCNWCKKCAEVCPSRAISFTERQEIDGVRRWKIDHESCFTFWCETGTDCGRCMAACPYAHPNTTMHRLVRWAITRNRLARRVAVKGDDLLYGRRPQRSPLPVWMD